MSSDLQGSAKGAPAPRMAGLRDAALISVAHSLLAGAMAWFWLGLVGAERGVLEAAWCVAPALLALGLSFTSQADRRQYGVRLLACSTGVAGAGLDGQPLVLLQHLRGTPCPAVRRLDLGLAAAVTRVEAVAGTVTLLCALVTRSGYAWQPVLGRSART